MHMVVSAPVPSGSTQTSPAAQLPWPAPVHAAPEPSRASKPLFLTALDAARGNVPGRVGRVKHSLPPVQVAAKGRITIHCTDSASRTWLVVWQADSTGR